MKLEEELKLSFYKEIAEVDKRHNVTLVQHADTGKVYVKKTLRHYDETVFRTLKEKRFPGVPVIKELIESDGSLIVIEDYISGHSLDEMLEARTFSAAETAHVITRLCDILDPIHSLEPPVIHRDIKASNVIVANEGKIYLIDFDASKVVTPGRKRDTDLLGTEQYAAPEQYGFGQSDCRTDIYALGVLMNKLLTGKFPTEEMHEGTLSGVIARATEMDPENRYQNVRILKSAVVEAVRPSTTARDVDRATQNAAAAQNDISAPHSNDAPLARFLSKLPYPVRELPGFRSGKVLNFCAALAGYILLFIFGFCNAAPSPEMTPLQNRFYDVEAFTLIFATVLYLGNYLGIRDRLPWRKSYRTGADILRICIGTLALLVIIFFVFSVAATSLGI